MPHAAPPAALLTLAALALAPAVAPAESFTSNGFEIHYDVLGQGAGDTVVLIHGYLGSAADWVASPVTARLAETHRVVAIDVRGHGQSDRSANPDDHGDEAVTDVVRLLDHLHVDRADVVGYSMGGCIALRLAVLHPDRVDEVVVGGAGFDRDFDKVLDAQVTSLAADLRAGRGFGRLFEFITEPEGVAPTPPEVVDAVNQQAFAAASPEEWAAVLEGYLDWQYTDDQLEACPARVLFVCGVLDPFIAAARGAALLMPNARLVELPAVAHTEAAARPEFTEAVADFVKPD